MYIMYIRIIFYKQTLLFAVFSTIRTFAASNNTSTCYKYKRQHKKFHKNTQNYG